MIRLTNAVLDDYAAQIVALGPLDCWGKVITTSRPVGEGSFRFHAYRTGEGRWCLTIDELRDNDADFEGVLDWTICTVEWKANGDALRRGELFPRNASELRAGLDILRAWADQRMVGARDKHPGSDLLWQAWMLYGIHQGVPLNWPECDHVPTSCLQEVQ